MRERIGALVLAAVAIIAACGGGGTPASGAPPSGGAAAVSPLPAACVNLASLGKTVGQLTSMKPGTDSTTSIRLSANNVVAQAATFLAAAPTEARPAVQALKDAVGAVRSAVGQEQATSEAIATALAGVDAAWKALETQMAATCGQ